MKTIQDGNPPITPIRYTKELHLLHVQAFWEGRLEYNSVCARKWVDAEVAPGTGSDPISYRIKQPKQLRPWTTNEVPLGAWIRLKGHQDQASVIVHRSIHGVRADTAYSLQELLKSYEHSTDQGQTWLPCGVLE